MDEQILVALCKDGDMAAMGELVAKYERRIYNFCYRVCGNRDDAYDLAQETFLRVCSAINSFRGDAPVSSWIYRIADNVCIDYIRRKSKCRSVSLDAPCATDDGEATWQVADRNPGPQEEVEYMDLKRAVMRGIGTLSASHRAVIVMHDVQEMTYEDISASLECPLGTVKSRLNRARFALKKYLEDEGYMNRSSLRVEMLA